MPCTFAFIALHCKDNNAPLVVEIFRVSYSFRSGVIAIVTGMLAVLFKNIIKIVSLEFHVYVTFLGM